MEGGFLNRLVDATLWLICQLLFFRLTRLPVKQSVSRTCIRRDRRRLGDSYNNKSEVTLKAF